MEKHILAKPIDYDGRRITEIAMDLEGLSVNDLERAEREARAMRSKKESSLMPDFDKKYQACVAAISAGLPVDLIRSLGAKDYTQICMSVQNFLLDGDSEEEETEPPKNGKIQNSQAGAKQPEAENSPNSKS